MTATMPPDTLAGYTDADIMTFCDQAVATGNDTWLAILTEEAARRDEADATRAASVRERRLGTAKTLVRRRAHAQAAARPVIRPTGTRRLTPSIWRPRVHCSGRSAERRRA